MTESHPYGRLTPDLVIDAVESSGRLTDLRIFPLNSYENRVYQVGIEDEEPIIVKFYRPERWSDAQILEEHDFCRELVEAEIPVIPPMADDSGKTLFEFKNFRFSMYKRQGGHAPELDNLDTIHMLGRLTARIHSVGAQKSFQHRPALEIKNFGYDSYHFIHEHFIPDELKISYSSLCEDLLAVIESIFQTYPATSIRVHGDCHGGNILWRGDTPHFVDLDDSRTAPAIQDLWMFLSGDRQLQTRQVNELVEGYNEFFDFDPRQLNLVESLRTLRIMHYSAWLARRWGDPAFPRNFPWFNTIRYWSDHILELREQLALIHEPPLELF